MKRTIRHALLNLITSQHRTQGGGTDILVNRIATTLLHAGMVAGLLGSVSNMVYVMSTGGQPDRIIVPVIPFTVLMVIWSETHPVEVPGDEHRAE